MRWRGAIFDLDGTLADTLPVSFAAFRRTLRETIGETWNNHEIRARFGPSEEGVLSGLGRNAATADAYALFLRLYEREHRRCPAAFPGIPALLRTLAEANVRCAVVTGKGADAAALTLARIGLSDAFEHVEAGSAGGAVKAQCMRRILASWDAPADRVASIGDFPSDMRAAREVRVTPLGAAWSALADRTALVEAGAERVFDRVDELGAWLLRGC